MGLVGDKVGNVASIHWLGGIACFMIGWWNFIRDWVGWKSYFDPNTLKIYAFDPEPFPTLQFGPPNFPLVTL